MVCLRLSGWRRDPPPSHSGDRPVCGGIGGGVSGAAAAAARIIDGLTAGLPLTFPAVLLYFGSLALEGMLSSAQESLLVLFGQKMTHALRSEMSRKLTKLPPARWQDRTPARWPRASRAMWIQWRRCSPPASSAWRRTPAASSPSWRSSREEYRSCTDFAAGAAAVRRVHPPCADADAGSAAG